MQRVFLDANILFSAAYREKAGLLRLWQLPGVDLVTSSYAAQEANANLSEPSQKKRLAMLLNSVAVMPHPAALPGLPSGMSLPAKDTPIFQAAMRAGASVLLTGDVAHFGRFFGKTIAGVRILLSADFLRSLKSDHGDLSSLIP
ncbi:MAG: PIN domain-containing protein [Kiritimatiellae bacterium]|nr:PIN domain-containing protein [Verrucomicrobiota bacterium]MCG2660896.1 PIN domain-containing protein [Kiritimatiellia bacterium]